MTRTNGFVRFECATETLGKEASRHTVKDSLSRLEFETYCDELAKEAYSVTGRRPINIGNLTVGFIQEQPLEIMRDDGKMLYIANPKRCFQSGVFEVKAQNYISAIKNLIREQNEKLEQIAQKYG